MRERPQFGLWLWVAVILVIVVPWGSFEDHMRGHPVGWLPFVSPPIVLRDIILNILLYVPLGYLQVRRSGPSHAGWAVLWALALSVATEATQIFSHRRYVSATDVVSNTIGAALGASVAILVTSAQTRRMPWRLPDRS